MSPFNPAPYPPDSVHKVVVAVCTRQRPVMLEQCLRSLLLQQVQSFVQLQLVVIENDAYATVESLVALLAADSPFPMTYVLEPLQGVSHARNRALSAALALGCDWLAFIDDDEVAETGWIDCLLRVAIQFRAEAVRGPVVYSFPKEDRWAYLRDSSNKHQLRPEGQPIKEGATNNVLIASRLFSAEGLALKFEPALNFTGGEDKLFFMQAFRAGVVAVFSPGAVVHETVPLSRCSFGMLYQDKARLAANNVRIARDFMGVTPDRLKDARQLLRESGNALKFAGKALKRLPRRDNTSRRYFLQAALSVARVHGTLLGLFGKRIESYRQVQGY